MPTRFVCLANSYKEGGRCLAGIVLNNNNNPVIENGRPKWIRPTCNTEHGEVHTHLVADIVISDIIELEVTKYINEGYQSENAMFREDSIRKVGKFVESDLEYLCEDRPLIFGNRGKAVPEEKIDQLDHSLMFISVSSFEVVEKVYDDSPEKMKLRLAFTYNDHDYNLPITDPVFIHKYQLNPELLENIEELYLSLSLGVVWDDWCYKLVAGIIPVL